MSRPDAGERAGPGEALAWAGLVGIAAVAVARCLVLFAPQRWFDVDPALHAAPLDGLGPAGSLALDVVLLLSRAVGLAGEARARRAVDPWLAGLALLPLPVALAHGWTDAGDLWRGSTWCAAALAAVTVAHLARDPRRRAVAVGVLLGALVPLLARGALQMTVEHADTIAAFEQTRGQFLAERGWEPDSPAALIYERRLRQPQPRGWFATSNVLASFMALGLAASLGLAIASTGRRLASGWTGVLALLALACGVALWGAGSKGGAGAALVAASLVVVAMLRPGLGAALQRRRGRLVAALILAVLAAVVVRGTLLPERFAGELSLLFRWHYLCGSAAILEHALPWGIGPDHFQEQYVLFRPPRSPEEVVSAHSMLVDWIVTLGVAGGAWCALVLALMRSPREPEPDPELQAADSGHERPDRTVGLALAIVGVVAIGLGAWVERATLDPLTGLVRLLGGAGLVVVGSVVAAIARHVTPAALGWAVAGGAVALLVHGQIEMTFFSPSAVTLAMLAVGLAAVPASSTGRRTGAVVAAIAVAAAGWILATGVVPAARQEAMVARAAAALQPPSDDAATLIRQRLVAIERLERAQLAWPTNAGPLLDASDQALAAAAGADGEARADLLRRSIGLAQRAAAEGAGPEAVVAAADAAARLALETRAPDDWDRAVGIARTVTHFDPHAIGSWTRLGDVLWEVGRRDEARDAYRRALERSDDFELDPLKQMGARRREMIERRMATEPSAIGHQPSGGARPDRMP